MIYLKSAATLFTKKEIIPPLSGNFNEILYIHVAQRAAKMAGVQILRSEIDFIQPESNPFTK